jgi:hypothetical protein
LKDFLEQDLEIGDYVTALFSENETPFFFQIKSFTPKKVKLQSVDGVSAEITKFPKDILKVESDAVEATLKEPPADALGQKLKVGDYVFGSDSSYIEPVIFEIKAFVPMVAILEKVYGEHYIRNNYRFTKDLIRIEPGLVTMCILKKET